MLAEVAEAPEVTERLVHVEVSSVVVRLALLYVAQRHGWRPYSGQGGDSCVVVSDRQPRGGEQLDVLVTRDVPAACQASVDAVLRGRTRAVVLWDEPEGLVTAFDALDRRATVIPERAIELSLQAPRLTDRQLDTIRLLAAGRSSRQIAEALHESESTAKRDIAELLDLFDAPNRTALVASASRLGFLRSLTGQVPDPAGLAS